MVTDVDLGWFQKELYDLHNRVRRQHKLDELFRLEQLEKLAIQHSKTMARNERMFHSDLGRFENVGFMSVTKEGDEHTLAMRMMNSWEHSSGHFKNIINPRIKFIGIGVAKDSAENPYFTVIFE